jgi:AcrR family transcriptional regulator
MTAPARGRPRDPEVSEAILAAARRLLSELGFAGMSIEAVAAAAGVGKPAIYRRFSGKADLVTAVIDRALPPMTMPDRGRTEADLRWLFTEGLPEDADAYLALIGGLMAERRRHPELIAAFRDRILRPRRAIVHAVILRGQQRGDVRADVSAEALLDLIAGPILARAFVGARTGPAWRREAFAAWWRLVAVPSSA